MAKRYKTSLYTGTAEGAYEGGKSDIEGLRDEISEWKENMESNSMEGLPKYDEVSECYDALETIYDRLEEVEFPEGMGDLPVTYSVMKPYGRKPEPRWMQLANAEAAISAAKDALERRLEELRDAETPECTCENPPEGEDEPGDDHELDCPLYREEDAEQEDSPDPDDIQTQIDTMDEALDECGNVNFPGMY